MSSKASNSSVAQMQELLMRVIENQESPKDKMAYEELRMDLIRELDAVDIPDFLFSVENADDFKKFISIISLTDYGKKKYINDIFNQLLKNNSGSKSVTAILDKALVETKQNSKISEENSKSISSKFIKYAWAFISLIATCATIYGVYLQIKSAEPKITVSSFFVSHLTIPPKVDGLKANYYYRDSAVSDLWRLDVIVKNTGEETLLTVGPKKNIISNDGLALNISKNFKILNINQVASSFPISIVEKNGSGLLLKFEQWRKGEEIKIEMYLENVNSKNNKNPFASINERQIVDGRSENLPYNFNTAPKKILLADYLPKFISTPLKWSLITIYTITGLIAFPAVVMSEIRGKKSPEDKRSAVVGGLFLVLLFSLPLLWLIPKFW